MSENKRNVLVGVFMVAGLGTGAALMVLFGEQPSWMGGAEYELSIDVRRLAGVQEGTPINMNGVEVGRVGRLEFKDPSRPDKGVSIVARIKNKYVVPKGTKARVYVSPIGLGRSRVELMVPELDMPALPTEGATIGGEMANVFEDIVPPTMLSSLERTARQIGDFAAELTPVAQDLHDILDKRTIADIDHPSAEIERVTANLYTVLQRFDRVLKHFNDVLGDPKVKSAMRESIENVHQVTVEARETLTNLRETTESLKVDVKRITDRTEVAVTDLTARVNTVGEAMLPVLENAAELTGYLSQAARELAEGRGSAGLLLRDDRMYESLLISIERLTDLVDTLRRLADKFERQGYVEFKAHTIVGPVKSTREIPE